MPALKRVFRVDKKTGEVVEVTQERVRRLAKWPLHSEAMAVNPEDVAKAQAILRQHGVSTEYDRLGRPILTSALHRKRHAEALGFYDRNGGYGDPQPKNR